MLIMCEVTMLLRELMFSEFIKIPSVKDVTLSFIAAMVSEFVLRLIIWEVTILLRVSMLFELIVIPSLKDVTLSFIAVMI